MHRITAISRLPAIDEMVRQTGAPQFDENGMLTRGTVIRHLMLPGLGGDTSQILRDIAVRWGNRVLVSLMRQYTPFDMGEYPELDRTITAEEYETACGDSVSSVLAASSAGRVDQRELYSCL